jgi:alkylhydroperoxidase family enzyme
MALAALEALHRDRDLDDAAWGELRRHLDEREAIELCLLAGHYEMLATAIAALRIQPDRTRGSY